VRMQLVITGVPSALLAGLIAAGCVDSGLPGENLPLEEARMKAPVYQTYDAEHRAGPVHYDGLDWLAAGPPQPISTSLLTAVPDAGAGVFVLANRSAPHARLYLRTENGFVPLAPAAVQGEAPPAAEAEHH
jgi:hypothetical protein